MVYSESQQILTKYRPSMRTGLLLMLHPAFHNGQFLIHFLPEQSQFPEIFDDDVFLLENYGDE